MDDLILKQFDKPDEVRNFEKGKFEIVHMPNMTIGRATYKPGWKWSNDVSNLSGTKFCEVKHLGMVIQGKATAQFEGEDPIVMNVGDIFYVSDKPHDSWVIGDDDYVSIHFLGADKYAD